MLTYLKGRLNVDVAARSQKETNTQMLVAALVAKNDFESFALDKLRATSLHFARNQRLTNSDHHLF